MGQEGGAQGRLGRRSVTKGSQIVKKGGPDVVGRRVFFYHIGGLGGWVRPVAGRWGQARGGLMGQPRRKLGPFVGFNAG